jgi:hypothetical protein
MHKETIVTPENVDAIRAISSGHGRDESMKMMDSSLGISSKRILVHRTAGQMAGRWIDLSYPSTFCRQPLICDAAKLDASDQIERSSAERI